MAPLFVCGKGSTGVGGVLLCFLVLPLGQDKLGYPYILGAGPAFKRVVQCKASLTAHLLQPYPAVCYMIGNVLGGICSQRAIPLLVLEFVYVLIIFIQFLYRQTHNLSLPVRRISSTDKLFATPICLARFNLS